MEPGAGVVLEALPVEGVLDEEEAVAPVVDPVEPLAGLAPVEPATPLPLPLLEAVLPVDPVEPVEPVDPLEPMEPADPVEPVEPLVPAEPGVEVPLVLAPDVGKLLLEFDGFCVVLPALVEAGEPLVEPEVEPVLLPGMFLLVSTMMLSFIKFDDQTSAKRTWV